MSMWDRFLHFTDENTEAGRSDLPGDQGGAGELGFKPKFSRPHSDLDPELCSSLCLFPTKHTTQIGSLPSSSCMKSTEVMSHKHHRHHTDSWTEQGGKTSRAEQGQGEFTNPGSGTLSPHGAPDLWATAVPTSLRFCPGSLTIYRYFVSHRLALKDGFR